MDESPAEHESARELTGAQLLRASPVPTLLVGPALRALIAYPALGRLASGVAHDFNNLLTVILASGQVLSESFDATDVRLRTVAAGGERHWRHDAT